MRTGNLVRPVVNKAAARNVFRKMFTSRHLNHVAVADTRFEVGIVKIPSHSPLLVGLIALCELHIAKEVEKILKWRLNTDFDVIGLSLAFAVL